MCLRSSKFPAISELAGKSLLRADDGIYIQLLGEVGMGPSRRGTEVLRKKLLSFQFRYLQSFPGDSG